MRTGRCSQPRTVEVRAWTALSTSTVPGREPLEDLVQGDAALQAGERGAETEVDAVAEGQVVVDLAVDVEAVRVGESSLVAVRRGGQEEHRAALRDHRAVVLDVGGHVPGLDRGGGLVAEQLLDGAGDEAAVLGQLLQLVRVVGQHLAGPADQAGGRLVAGRRQQADVAQHLVAGESSRSRRPRPRTPPGGARSSGRRTGARLASRCTPRRRRRRPGPRTGPRSRAWNPLPGGGRRPCGRGWPPGPVRGCRGACRWCAWASGRRGRR